MPNSLKSKLKKLVYQGHLTEKDLSRLYTDNDVVAELEKIKTEIEEHNRKYLSDDNAGLERAIYDFIEPHISELKGENK